MDSDGVNGSIQAEDEGAIILSLTASDEIIPDINNLEVNESLPENENDFIPGDSERDEFSSRYNLIQFLIVIDLFEVLNTIEAKFLQDNIIAWV